MLVKSSLANARLVAMLKARHSRGSDGDDGATIGWASVPPEMFETDPGHKTKTACPKASR